VQINNLQSIDPYYKPTTLCFLAMFDFRNPKNKHQISINSKRQLQNIGTMSFGVGNHER